VTGEEVFGEMAGVDVVVTVPAVLLKMVCT